ncbi:hypothetical protein PBP221_84760 (plasmid) [Paraburkholderia sp. 22B1P]|nr:hypothetical protein PBP221_84760 [Paraburkholderia sp. 22B1P]
MRLHTQRSRNEPNSTFAAVQSMLAAKNGNVLTEKGNTLVAQIQLARMRLAIALTYGVNILSFYVSTGFPGFYLDMMRRKRVEADSTVRTNNISRELNLMGNARPEFFICAVASAAAPTT